MIPLFRDALNAPGVILLLKASVLLALSAAAVALLRHRASAATRHGVLTLAVVSLLLLPPLSAGGPQWPLRLPVSDGATITAAPTVDILPTLPPATSAAHVMLNAGDRDAASVAAAPSTSGIERIAWPAIALAMYAAGALLLLARLVLEHLSGCRLVRSAEAIRDEGWTAILDESARRLGMTRQTLLLRATEHVTPMTIGLRRPAILLPDDADEWSADRRRSVILHELAHIDRRDCLTQTLASVATAIYWPHPGIWWAARRLRVEREFACDDRVLGSGATAGEYANDLLEIAYTLGARRAPALAVAMARRGQLEGRLLAVLDAARNRAMPGVRSRIAAALATAAILVPVAALGITTYAASMPLGMEADIPVKPMATIVAGHDRQAAAAGAASGMPRRLAKTLYSWTDVVERLLPTSGTWSIQPSEKPGQIHLEMRQLNWSSGHSMPLSALNGLTSAQMMAGGPVKFAMKREAGTFTFEGVFRDGMGGGTYSFSPNPGFGDELAKRGVGRPSPVQQYQMALGDVGFALVDGLKAQGYQTPTTEELVQCAQHGVDGSYVQEMGALGYKAGSVASLISMRDHGVTPDYVKGMLAEGLPKLSAEDLVRARDHGVTPDYVRSLKQFGFNSLDFETLVASRDHGISPDFVKQMADQGYRLTLDELKNTRDHGITPDYIRELASLGYAKLSLLELVNARNHGITPDFVRELQALGYKPSLPELVTTRDHGVTPGYVRELKDLGYSSLSLQELVTLRDHGATPERVKRANDEAGTKLSPEMLRTVMDGGLR